jgi:hypothetical protein
MKKIICIMVVVLMVASVVYAQKAKKAGITAKDLPALKGTYTGMLSFGDFEGGGTSACTLEILNDTVPVKAKLTISSVPQVVASAIGLSTTPEPMTNDEGTLTTQGTIMFAGAAKNWVEVSKAGDKKVKVYYYFRGLKGDGTLTKK